MMRLWVFQGEVDVLGIFLTIIAVFFVVCVAFYFSDHPKANPHGSDALFRSEVERKIRKLPER